jgi:hypothetical protein
MPFQKQLGLQLDYCIKNKKSKNPQLLQKQLRVFLFLHFGVSPSGYGR